MAPRVTHSGALPDHRPEPDTEPPLDARDGGDLGPGASGAQVGERLVSHADLSGDRPVAACPDDLIEGDHDQPDVLDVGVGDNGLTRSRPGVDSLTRGWPLRPTAARAAHEPDATTAAPVDTAARADRHPPSADLGFGSQPKVKVSTSSGAFSDSTRDQADAPIPKRNGFVRRPHNWRPAPVGDPAYAGFSKRHTERWGAELVRQIATYEPQDMPAAEWEVIAWYVREVIALTMNPAHKDPVSNVHSISRYVHWAHLLNGRPLEHAAIFERTLIIAFTESALPGRRDEYVATERARLISIAKRVNRSEKPLPTKKRARVGNPPYASAEIDRFRNLAPAICSAYARRSVRLILALSTGAGLNPSDYINLRNRHIRIDASPGGGIIVDVQHSGQAARTSLRARRVALWADWESEVRDLMSEPGLDPDGFVVWEKVGDRHALQALTQGLQRTFPNRGQRPRIDRLRTTWIVNHVRAGTPVPVLTVGGGFRDAESLARYMQFVEMPDEATQMRMLRGTPSSERVDLW